jgi:tetratricopeptide (TPR) repeat protein
MKKIRSIVCPFVLLSFALAFGLQIACKPAPSGEVPITTKSKEARRLFVEGRDQMEYYHLDKANDLLKGALALDPAFTMAQLFYAANAATTEEFQSGLAKAVALAASASEGERKIIAWIEAANLENNASKANRICQDLAALYPKDKRVQLYLAGTYGSLQKYGEQLAAIDRAVALDPAYAPAYEALGYYHRNTTKDLDKAESAFKQYARLAPAEANSHDLLGDVYMKMGRFDDAIRAYGEAVRMDPAFFYSQQKIGSCLYFLGKYEEGRSAYRKAMDMPVRSSVKVYDQEGVMRGYIYEGDYVRAIEAADEGIRMAQALGLPEDATFLPLVKANIYKELGDLDKADACVAECLTALDKVALVAVLEDNQKASATHIRGLIAADRKDIEKALAAAESFRGQVATMNNPALEKQTGWLLGYIAIAQGEPAKAVGLYGTADTVDTPYHLYYLGLAKELSGDAAGAAEVYKKVVDWNSDDSWYAFVRGKAIARLK